MNKNLIIRAFEKAAWDLSENHGIHDAPEEVKAQRIVNVIEEQSGVQITTKTLCRYVMEARQISEEPQDIIIARKEVVDGLCHYLGFDSFKSFKDHIKDHKEYKSRSIKQKTVVLISILSGVLAVITLGWYYIHEDHIWMVWNEDHYEEASFSFLLLTNGTLKFYKKDSVLHFRKVLVDCQIPYVSSTQEPQLWYGENKDHTLEAFSASGSHPETGEPLKPITSDVFKTHFCQDESNN